MRPALVWLTPFLLCSCQEATQVTLDLRTDVPCDPSADGDALGSVAIYTVDVAALSSDEPVFAPAAITGNCDPADPVNTVGSLAFVPGDGGPEEALGIRLHLGVGDQTGEGCASATCGDTRCIDIRRRISFVPQQSLVLPITASRNCLGKCCEDEQPGTTCVDGACVPIEEQSTCNPDEGPCDPPPPQPPENDEPLVVWGKAIPVLGHSLTIDAVTLRDTANGPVVAIGGKYTTENATPLVVAGQPLPTSPAGNVFFATLNGATGEFNRVSVCEGASPELRDLSILGEDVHALVMKSATSLACGRVGASDLTDDSLVGPAVSPLVVSDKQPSPGPGALAITQLLSANSDGAPAHSLVALVNGFLVSGTSGGQPVVAHDGGDVADPFAAFMWLLESRDDGPDGFAPSIDASAGQAQAHYLTHEPTTGELWQVAHVEEPGGSSEVRGALYNAATFPPPPARGSIVAVGRPRPVIATRDVVVPVQLGGAIRIPEQTGAEGVAILRFNHPSSTRPAQTEVLLSTEGVSAPLAAARGDRHCLAFVRQGVTYLRCEGAPEVALSPSDEEVDLRALAMADLDLGNGPETVVLLVGIQQGEFIFDLDGSSPAFNVFIALLRLP